MFKNLITLLVLQFFLEILKKKALKMTSQLVIFRTFSPPPPPLPDPKSEKKNPVNQLIKKILALLNSQLKFRSAPPSCTDRTFSLAHGE